MIEMDNVILLELSAVKKGSHYTRSVRYLDANCIFDCPHRGQSMCISSDAAGALDKMLRVPRITALKDKFNASEHLA